MIMTAIVMVSITIGCFMGYKVGYSRCSYQFSKALEAVKASVKNRTNEK